jgi:hypothetical protein
MQAILSTGVAYELMFLSSSLARVHTRSLQSSDLMSRCWIGEVRDEGRAVRQWGTLVWMKLSKDILFRRKASSSGHSTERKAKEPIFVRRYFSRQSRIAM